MNDGKRKMLLLLQVIEHYKRELETAKELDFKDLEELYSKMVCMYEEELEEIKEK